MKKQLLYGALAVLASMPGALMLRALGLGGEDWLATALMRYVWSIMYLSALIRYKQGPETACKVYRLFRQHSRFWIIWGVISGPLSYLPYIYAATCVPMWIIAATCRLQMLTNIVVLHLFGQRVERTKALTLVIVFAGVVLMNLDHAGGTWKARSTLAVVLLAVGTLLDSLEWQDARWGRVGRPTWIPHIKGGVGASTHCWLLLAYLMSLPQMAIGLAIHPAMPSWKQVWCTALMAAFTSMVSVPLWMKFRVSVGTEPNHIALADAMPALGVMFSLFAEVWLLHGSWPGLLGFAGIGCVIGGFFLYLRR